jgi:hypothetical protein
MKNKNDVLVCFRNSHKGVQTQYETIIKILKFDSGTIDRLLRKILNEK